MGKRRKTKQFQIKNIISLKDKRREKPSEIKKPEKQKDPDVKYYEKPQFHLYFLHNTSLGPPYHILLDTNFINFSIKNKLDIFKSSMDCLLGKVIPCLTDCVLAELEKLGIRYRMALKISKDPRFMRLSCSHKGTYADDCLVRRVTTHRCFIVATCDKDLKRRLRKVPGVPIMYISNHKYTIERMPEALGAPRT